MELAHVAGILEFGGSTRGERRGLDTRASYGHPLEQRMRFAVEGDGGMLLHACSGDADRIRISTRVRGLVVEVGDMHLVIAYGTVPVTLRYFLPETVRLDWLKGKEVDLQVNQVARGGDFAAQCLIIRDDNGVLLSACDGEEVGDSGLGVRARPMGARVLALMCCDQAPMLIEVGGQAPMQILEQRYRAWALRAGRAPAFLLIRE